MCECRPVASDVWYVLNEHGERTYYFNLDAEQSCDDPTGSEFPVVARRELLSVSAQKQSHHRLSLSAITSSQSIAGIQRNITLLVYQYIAMAAGEPEALDLLASTIRTATVLTLCYSPGLNTAFVVQIDLVRSTVFPLK